MTSSNLNTLIAFCAFFAVVSSHGDPNQEQLLQASRADLATLSADEVLNRITRIRLFKKRIETQDALLLDRLDELVLEGDIDAGGFTHNDWSFAHSDGKTAYTYPEPITQLEYQLKAAKDAAKASGTAVKVKGEKAFWTITPPKI